MADMPSNRRPPPRPAPPSDRRRSGSGPGSPVRLRTRTNSGPMPATPRLAPTERERERRDSDAGRTSSTTPVSQPAPTPQPTPPPQTPPPRVQEERQEEGSGGEEAADEEEEEVDYYAMLNLPRNVCPHCSFFNVFARLWVGGSWDGNWTLDSVIGWRRAAFMQLPERWANQLLVTRWGCVTFNQPLGCSRLCEVSSGLSGDTAALQAWADSGATDHQITSAYRLLSRRIHPDKEPPDLRASATEHQKRIGTAYETLIDPAQRLIYDQFGVRGLRDRAWQVGVKTKSPEELKDWIRENMAQARLEELDELVSSTGRVVAKVNVTGCFYEQIMEKRRSNGRVTRRVVELPKFSLTQYTVKHGFAIPLNTVGQWLDTPLPTSFKQLWTAEEAKKAPAKRQKPSAVPHMQLNFSLGGRTDQKAPYIAANPGCGVSVSHGFPTLPPDAPPSLSRLLEGNIVSTTVTVLPMREVTTQIARSVGQNQVLLRSTWISALNRFPILEANLTRRLGLRHSFYTEFTAPHWAPLTNFAALLSLPQPGSMRQGVASIGYSFLPRPAAKSSHRPSSASTASYTAILSAGTLVRGFLLRLTYTRTLFLGSPVGRAQRTANAPSSIGLRLAADIALSASTGVTYTLRATRKWFSHTTAGLALSIGGAAYTEGVVLSLTWSRLGQSFTLPVVVAPLPESRAVLAAAVLPVVVYAAAELCWLRPADRRARAKDAAVFRAQQRGRTNRARAAAAEAVALMHTSAAATAAQEAARGGLVIMSASWGTVDGKAGVDVTVPLMSMVNAGQIVIARGVDKSRLMGFYDPAPGSEKRLTVRYEFHGALHGATVREGQGFVAPQKVHLLPPGEQEMQEKQEKQGQQGQQEQRRLEAAAAVAV
ncbi:hypothetical protein EDC01DRAFT_633204 [Geopyxis carbonaria]|nr:hypothetical protein EDC01DRAFT_633204 [Geopyxis carbonaria]